MPATRILKSSGFPEALHSSQMPALSLPHSIHKQRRSPASLCCSTGIQPFVAGGEGGHPPALHGGETPSEQFRADTEMASATKSISLIYRISLQIDNISRQKEPLGRGSLGKTPSTPQCDSHPASSSAGTSQVAVRPAASLAQSIFKEMSWNLWMLSYFCFRKPGQDLRLSYIQLTRAHHTSYAPPSTDTISGNLCNNRQIITSDAIWHRPQLAQCGGEGKILSVQKTLAQKNILSIFHFSRPWRVLKEWISHSPRTPMKPGAPRQLMPPPKAVH